MNNQPYKYGTCSGGRDDFLASRLGVTGTEVTIFLGDSTDGRGVN